MTMKLSTAVRAHEMSNCRHMRMRTGPSSDTIYQNCPGDSRQTLIMF